MAKSILSPMGNSGYVTLGYGQVEPNHLSAQRTGQIYAQLPAASTINVLEQGQFVKYDYSAGVVDFVGAGEWMLVYNEVKLYRDGLGEADFALVKTDYAAAIYSPVNGTGATSSTRARDYRGIAANADQYEPTSTNDPFHIDSFTKPMAMPTGTTMVPRVFKTNIGDIFTTNTVKETTLAVGDVLAVGDDGYLCLQANKGSNAGDMRWQVVKVYTLPDRQPAVKIMRIA